MSILLIIIVLLVIFGGGFWGFRTGGYAGWSPLGIIVLVLILWYFFGRGTL